MFTGIISGLGRIERVEPIGGDDAHGKRLTLSTPPGYLDDVALGDSIAINGACMTVTAFDPAAQRFSIDISAESLRLTAGLDRPGAVNLEKAMRPSDRLGGHLVSGHVDGLAAAERRWDDARAVRWRFSTPRPLLRYIAHKGSVCVDGVSLTVNAADDTGFEVALIPHTVEHTAFRALQVGDAVNIEVDLLARYAERLQATKDWT